jgi:hypothetical protein
VRIELDEVFRDVPTWKILEIVKVRIVNGFLKDVSMPSDGLRITEECSHIEVFRYVNMELSLYSL